MSRTPTATIVIPVKNGAEHIATTLASLGRQFADPYDLEVVVIDDGSTDATLTLVADAGQVLPQLVVEHWDVSRGVGAGRVRGLELATGTFVGFIDGDDWFADRRLETLVGALQTLDVDFVRTDHVKADGVNRTLHRAPQGRRNVALNPRDSILPVAGSSMVDYPFPPAGMFHRRMLEQGTLAYDAELRTAEDRVAAWRFHLKADSFAVVDAPAMFYRRGIASSLTQIYDSRQLDFVRAFELIHDLLKPDPEYTTYVPKLIRQFFAIADHHARRAAGMDRRTKQHLAQLVGGFVDLLPAAMVQAVWEGNDLRRQLRLSAYTGLSVREGVAL
ncbi:MAG: glycosyltransferase family 2 protein [Propioniciclava sp.]